VSKTKYYYTHREANFGKPLRTEVSGGAHLTFDVVLHRGASVYALRLPAGLHDGPKNALYFPHGLIRFGETVLDCARRLAKDQAAVDVTRAGLYTLPSWVDENDHWHLCLNVLAEVEDVPPVGGHVSEVVEITSTTIPDEFGWWTVEQMASLLGYLDVLDGTYPYT
jgi:ADP-ribose pyrophosphatase YjhB (NUDIX family)